MDIPYLRDLRRRAVMSQEQLSERSGVARDTISKLETGRRKAYPTTIRKLAAGLDVEPRMLLGGVVYLEDTGDVGETPNQPDEGTGKRRAGF